MKIPRFLTYFLLLFFAISLSVGLAAAESKKQKVKYRNLDRNNDGEVSRAEWRGNSRSFQNQDWNGDGVLSGNEVIQGADRNDYYGQGTFSSLDDNHDGYLSRYEWRETSSIFGGKDCNHDNKVSRTEYFTQDCASSTCDYDCLFRELDVNSNGLVSRSEWRGSGQTFDRLDQNSSNGLTRSELSRVNQRGQGNNQVLDSVTETINMIFGQ